MLDKEALALLLKAQAISAASAAMHDPCDSTVALPADFTVHDLERFAPTRRRLRGTMTTSSPTDFAAYAKDNAEDGAVVFVNRTGMTADAVLNLGTVDIPGHADHRAQLRPIPTAAYSAMRKLANGQGLTQQQVAEFLEDWPDNVTCERDGDTVPVRQAIAAVRSITIEALNKLASEEQQLSATRSTFEHVKATSTETLPAIINFDCVPLHGLASRTFSLRLAIHTGGQKPAITLRVVNDEQHLEDMAQELATLVAQAIGDGMPVMVGTFQAGT